MLLFPIQSAFTEKLPYFFRGVRYLYENYQNSIALSNLAGLVGIYDTIGFPKKSLLTI